MIKIENDDAYVELLKPYLEERAEKFKKFPNAFDEDGKLITDRNEYLNSLPQDEDGLIIINQEEFDALAFEFDWETEFLMSYVIEQSLISAWDFDEFFEITE